MERIPFERHHHGSRPDGGPRIDLRPRGEYDPPPTEVEKALERAKTKALPDGLVSRVIAPLCRLNVSNCLPEGSEPDGDGPEKAVISLVWSSLQASGFEMFFCFVRGYRGEEEVCVVLPEGSVSWPVRLLTPEAEAFVEVMAL